LKRATWTSRCIQRIGDYGDNFLAGAEGSFTDTHGGSAEGGADHTSGQRPEP
jgi:hypothetical protein